MSAFGDGEETRRSIDLREQILRYGHAAIEGEHGDVVEIDYRTPVASFEQFAVQVSSTSTALATIAGNMQETWEAFTASLSTSTDALRRFAARVRWRSDRLVSVRHCGADMVGDFYGWTCEACGHREEFEELTHRYPGLVG